MTIPYVGGSCSSFAIPQVLGSEVRHDPSTAKDVLPTAPALVDYHRCLIVFLTFVVNDVLRERLKDMASSIANAQDVLSIRTDIQRFRDESRLNQVVLKNEIRGEVALLGPPRKRPISVAADLRPEGVLNAMRESLVGDGDILLNTVDSTLDRVRRLL